MIGEAAAKGLRFGVAYLFILALWPMVIQKFAPAAKAEQA